MCFKAGCFFKTCCRLLIGILNDNCSCRICGKSILDSVICKTCYEKYFLKNVSSFKLLQICSSQNSIHGNTFIHNFDKNVLNHIDKMVCLFPYDLWNKDLLYIWKTADDRSLSPYFAKLIYKVLKQNHIDVIIPVPPRPGKIKEKGWDQIDELSNYLEFFFGVKVLKLLQRKGAVQQKKLNREERLKESKLSYFWKGEKELGKILNNNAVPQKVCLLDDVMTTGATLENCGKVLKEGGVKEVSAVTLFMV